MEKISKLDALIPLNKIRQKAREDFLEGVPDGLKELAKEYRTLKVKENSHRRFLNAAKGGIVHKDIEDGAGFAYEGIEPLSSEEAARFVQLEKTKELQDFFDKELDFRRKLYKLEEKHFNKVVLKKK